MPALTYNNTTKALRWLSVLVVTHSCRKQAPAHYPV